MDNGRSRESASSIVLSGRHFTASEEEGIMASPFPGMVPYLEEPSGWPSVHHWLICAIGGPLIAQLAPHLAAADVNAPTIMPNGRCGASPDQSLPAVVMLMMPRTWFGIAITSTGRHWPTYRDVLQ
jgi:hypothetical protein